MTPEPVTPRAPEPYTRAELTAIESRIEGWKRMDWGRFNVALVLEACDRLLATARARASSPSPQEAPTEDWRNKYWAIVEDVHELLALDTLVTGLDNRAEQIREYLRAASRRVPPPATPETTQRLWADPKEQERWESAPSRRKVVTLFRLIVESAEVDDRAAERMANVFLSCGGSTWLIDDEEYPAWESRWKKAWATVPSPPPAVPRDPREDSARLDWLEANPNRVYIGGDANWYVRQPNKSDYESVGPFETKRAAIDEARAVPEEHRA